MRGKAVVVTAVQEAVLAAPVEQVWQVVTSIEKYAWRRDIKEIRRLDGSRFVEYTKDGFSTVFTVTVQNPCCRWAFTLDNQNLHGTWEGEFQSHPGGTLVRFTERVTPKKWYLRPLVKGYLKRQQAQYVEDLRRVLEEQA